MTLASLYPHDKLVPGVSLAYLPSDALFYGSIVRFNGNGPNDKDVLLSVKEPTVLDVIQELLAGWMQRTQAAQQLCTALKRPHIRRSTVKRR